MGNVKGTYQSWGRGEGVKKGEREGALAVTGGLAGCQSLALSRIQIARALGGVVFAWFNAQANSENQQNVPW